MAANDRFSDTAHLLTSMSSGDPGAIHALLVKYQDKIHRLARIKLGQKLRSKMDSMDIVQDALLTALESLKDSVTASRPKTFSSEPELLAWLYRIVESRIVDVGRHFNAGKRDMSSETSLDDTDIRRSVEKKGAAKLNPVSDWEDMILLESLLDQIKEEEKDLLVDRDIYEFSFQEMAGKRHKSPAAVRMQYHRVKFKLSRMLIQHG